MKIIESILREVKPRFALSLYEKRALAAALALSICPYDIQTPDESNLYVFPPMVCVPVAIAPLDGFM